MVIIIIFSLGPMASHSRRDCFYLTSPKSRRKTSKNTWAANTNLTIPQLYKSVQRFWRYEVIKNNTYIQDTREKHNPSLAVGKNISC